MRPEGWESPWQEEEDFTVSALLPRAGKCEGGTFRTSVWPFHVRLLEVSASLSDLGYTQVRACKKTDRHTPGKSLNWKGSLGVSASAHPAQCLNPHRAS